MRRRFVILLLSISYSLFAQDIGNIPDSVISTLDSFLSAEQRIELLKQGHLFRSVYNKENALPRLAPPFAVPQTFAENCDFAWDIAVEPGVTKKATHFFSNACVINPDSKNREAAAKWITWLTSSDKSAEIRLADGWDLPAIKNEDTLKSYLDQKKPENRQAVFDSLNFLVIPPVIEDYTMMSDIIGEKLKAAASGSMTVEEALNAAQKQCEEKVKIK